MFRLVCSALTISSVLPPSGCVCSYNCDKNGIRQPLCAVNPSFSPCHCATCSYAHITEGLTIDLDSTFFICLGDLSDQLPPSSPSQRASATVFRAPSSPEDLVTILVVPVLSASAGVWFVRRARAIAPSDSRIRPEQIRARRDQNIFVCCRGEPADPAHKCSHLLLAFSFSALVSFGT